MPLNHPDTVVVYADSNFEHLTPEMITQSGVFRFRASFFCDNGVIRLDCNEILDGVTE